MKTERYDVIIDTRATIKTLWFSAFSLRTKYRIGTSKFYNHFFHNYRVSSIGSFLFMLINGYFIFMYFIPEFVLQAQ